MPKKHKNLTDYKNFWLIWLSCAGSPDGVSLFNIQKIWGIETNYLYHIESGLGKPLFKAMMDEGYIKKEGRKVKAVFDWVTEYVIKRHRLSSEGGWTPDMFVIEKWTAVQRFMEKNAAVFFELKFLMELYERKLEYIKDEGGHIFDDIFLFVFLTSIAPLCKKYHAENVIRVAHTTVGLAAKRELLKYFGNLRDKFKGTKDFPVIVENEEEFLKVLSPA